MQWKRGCDYSQRAEAGATVVSPSLQPIRSMHREEKVGTAGTWLEPAGVWFHSWIHNFSKLGKAQRAARLHAAARNDTSKPRINFKKQQLYTIKITIQNTLSC